MINKLIRAATLGDINKVKSFIRKGVCLNQKDSDGDTALHGACWNYQPEMVKLLLENGADVNAVNNLRSVALFETIPLCHMNIIKILLKHGADLNIKNKYGISPLTESIYWGNIEVVKLLIQYEMERNDYN